MLGLTLNEGEFVSIGDAVLRLTEVRTRAQIRLAIQAPESLHIFRFSADGRPNHLLRKVIKVRSHVDDRNVTPGRVMVLLSCGHEFGVNFDWHRLPAMECPHCRLLAVGAAALIKTVFDQTADEIKLSRHRGGKPPLPQFAG
jgi:hypothetical protein